MCFNSQFWIRLNPHLSPWKVKMVVCFSLIKLSFSTPAAKCEMELVACSPLSNGLTQQAATLWTWDMNKPLPMMVSEFHS